MTGRQRRTPAVFVRGGTSKGVFFHERDLPTDRAARDSLFLAVLGSPDPYGRQLDGMGGGISSLSKAVIIGPPSRPDADVDYTFGQVQVDRALVDYGGTCGNLASAVGPFAYEEGLVSVDGPEAVVRIHATNTGKIIVSRFQVADGEAVVEGDFELPGIAGTGAPIKLEFLDPGGGNAGRMLPTGNVVDDLDLGDFGTIRASLVNAGNACVFVAAKDVGLTGAELPGDLDADKPAKAKLEAVRAAAGVLMGYGATAQAVTQSSPGNPKVAVVAEPASARRLDGGTSAADAMDISLRMLSMGLAHKASPLTGALCLAVAARIEGTVPHACVAAAVQAREALRLGTPSGVFAVSAKVERRNGEWHADHAAVYRTTRRLMEGAVLTPR